VRIHDLGAALFESGFITLDEQSTALGLPRSTTWTIVSGNHKASGLLAPFIIRMLSAPHLPELVRIKLLTYVDEKLAGLYGHNRAQCIRFAAHCSSMGSTSYRALMKCVAVVRLLSQVNSPRIVWRTFARWNKAHWGFLLLLVFVGNVLVATVAWIAVRLVTG
jgi:hypothetical protein